MRLFCTRFCRSNALSEIQIAFVLPIEPAFDPVYSFFNYTELVHDQALLPTGFFAVLTVFFVIIIAPIAPAEDKCNQRY